MLYKCPHLGVFSLKQFQTFKTFVALEYKRKTLCSSYFSRVVMVLVVCIVSAFLAACRPLVLLCTACLSGLSDAVFLRLLCKSLLQCPQIVLMYRTALAVVRRSDVVLKCQFPQARSLLPKL